MPAVQQARQARAEWFREHSGSGASRYFRVAALFRLGLFGRGALGRLLFWWRSNLYAASLAEPALVELRDDFFDILGDGGKATLAIAANCVVALGDDVAMPISAFGVLRRLGSTDGHDFVSFG